MISILSVPRYLFKNTLHRWVENLASPATKFLIPFLFALLGLLVFGLLGQVEDRLRAQLALDELRGIRCHEVVFSKEAQMRLLSGLDESFLWEDSCDSYESYMQPPFTVSTRGLEKLPLMVYDKRPSFVPEVVTAPGEPRVALLLTDEKAAGQRVKIRTDSLGLEVSTIPVPAILKKRMQSRGIVVLPIELARKLLERGFTKVQIMVPKEDVSTKELENRVRQHAYAEGRSVRVQSAQEILDELEGLLKYQTLAKWGVGLGVLAVLSLVLGSLSLLEFRQEAYLYALLKSFGVRSWQLFIHGVGELLVLSFAGLMGGALFYYWLMDLGGELGWWKRFGLDVIPQKFAFGRCLEQSFIDGGPLYLATGIGCLLASLPLAFALRKSAGLLLP